MKIKKLFVLILSIITVIMCVCFAGCEESNIQSTPIDTVSPSQNNTNIYCLISKEILDDDTTIFVVYHKDTKILYTIIKVRGMQAVGVSIQIMLDKDGKPLLYEGD